MKIAAAECGIFHNNIMLLTSQYDMLVTAFGTNLYFALLSKGLSISGCAMLREGVSVTEDSRSTHLSIRVDGSIDKCT